MYGGVWRGLLLQWVATLNALKFIQIIFLMLHSLSGKFYCVFDCTVVGKLVFVTFTLYA